MSGIKEIHFEDSVYDYLKESKLYTTRNSSDFDYGFVLDKSLLEEFIRTSQPDSWHKLEKQFHMQSL